MEIDFFHRKLIDFTSSDEPMWRGYVYAAVLFLLSVIQTILSTQHLQRIFLVGMKVKTSLIATIYKKSLRLSCAARKKYTVGEIVNLMSVDADRFVDKLVVNTIWSGPIQISLAIYFLWQILGVATLAGVITMIIFLLLNAWLVHKNRDLQVKLLKNRDIRVKLINEVLSGIKVLKLYSWETSFEKNIFQIRKKEVKFLGTYAYIQAGIMFVSTCTPIFVSLRSAVMKKVFFFCISKLD